MEKYNAGRKISNIHGMVGDEKLNPIIVGNNDSFFSHFVGKSPIVGYIKVGGNSIQENRLYELVLAYNNASPDRQDLYPSSNPSLITLTVG